MSYPVARAGEGRDTVFQEHIIDAAAALLWFWKHLLLHALPEQPLRLVDPTSESSLVFLGRTY